MLVVGSESDPAQLAGDTLSRVDSDNIVAMFCTNQTTIESLLGQTNGGADLPTSYSSVTVVGFDAGSTQKNAVEQDYILGSFAQDPYSMGYEAVVLAYDAYQGNTVSDVDTGVVFYDSSNMNDSGVANLLYD